MTTPRKSDLVLEGNTIKLRLQAERSDSGQFVHVDWVRFTVKLKNAPTPEIDLLFPEGVRYESDDEAQQRYARMVKVLRELPDGEFAASVQAKALAQKVCETLGDEFTVYPEVRKGHDFYRYRWSIVRNEVECGWVGYLASGESPRQLSQAKTIHANIYGTACTFADFGFNKRIAALIDSTEAIVTRVDLALDFFDGLSGGMQRVYDDYVNGAMNVHGNKPSCNQLGDWPNARGRSFYVGSREAGKQTNAYEKGHMLFGPKDPSQWVRIELRYGNKLRVLPSDLLRRPSDFFAGASDWHAQLLSEAAATVQAPEPVKTSQRLKSDTVVAAVRRNVQWLRDTGAPSVALAFQHLGIDQFLELVINKKPPASLQKFSASEVQRAYQTAFIRSSGSSVGLAGFKPVFGP